MPNIAVTARFNESKHQMGSQLTDDADKIDNLAGTYYGIMFKTVSTGVNQVSFKSFHDKVINYCIDYNVLERIAAGEWTGTHIMVSIDVDGALTTQVVPAVEWWDAAPDNSVSVAIPLAAGWSRDDSSTVYLSNIAKRTFEKMRETFLVKF